MAAGFGPGTSSLEEEEYPCWAGEGIASAGVAVEMQVPGMMAVLVFQPLLPF